MALWNGEFSRFEIHFGYPNRDTETQKIFWLPMAWHNVKRSLGFALSIAEHKSAELKIYIRVFDASAKKFVAMFRAGRKVGFSPLGEPVVEGSLPEGDAVIAPQIS